MAQLRQKQKAFVSGVVLSLVAATVQAQGLDDLDDDHGGSLGTHVHGIASLNMALDGKFLELEFHTPAANVYGFEHAPRNEVQLSQAREAQRTLQKADQLFVLTPAADCRLGRVELELGSEDGYHHEEHVGHEHHEEKHAEHGNHHAHEDRGKDEHEQAHHDKHADHDDHHTHQEHAHHAGEEDTHSDLSVHYYYQCSAPEKLNSLEVGLFKVFPALEKLNLQLITPRVQQGETLTARSYRVDF